MSDFHIGQPIYAVASNGELNEFIIESIGKTILELFFMDTDYYTTIRKEEVDKLNNCWWFSDKNAALFKCKQQAQKMLDRYSRDATRSQQQLDKINQQL